MTLNCFKYNEVFSANIYVVDIGGVVFVIDPGTYDSKLKSYLKKLGHVDAILLTHGHSDHIGGVDKIIADFPDCVLYISKNDALFLTNPHLNLSSYDINELLIKTTPVLVNEGVINVKGVEIEIISTPGHTSGSVMYLFKNEKLLFPGDFISIDAIGATHFPTGNEADMIKSIKKFYGYQFPENTYLCSSHWTNSSVEDVKKYNRYIQTFCVTK